MIDIFLNPEFQHTFSYIQKILNFQQCTDSNFRGLFV